MVRPIAYDVLRLMLGPLHETPRGIDRIDFGIATSLHADWPEAVNGIALMPWGLRYFGREKLAEGIDRLGAMWRERITRDEDLVYQRLRRFLADPAGSSADHALRTPRWLAKLHGGLRLARFMTEGGKWEVGRKPQRLPRNSLYLSIGHYAFGMPRLLSWLDDRRDVAAVFMLHDVIPLDAPELVAPSGHRLHRNALAAIVTHADALIAPSEAAKQAVLAELHRRGAREIPVHAISSPVDAAFLAPAEPDPDLAARCYFVICGAIETRKNHRLLLEVWRELVLRHGEDTPALLIIGAPGFGYGAIRDHIDRCPPLRDFVHVSIGLSTPALRSVVQGARALLMPSFAEGFGLPAVEALAVGTPVIVSDIPAHRESAGSVGIFLDPADAAGWRDEIERMMRDTTGYLALRGRIAAFRPKTWKQYMSEVQEVLLSFG